MSRKEQIKELLIFTKGEKKGIIVLMILIVIVILINIFYKYFIPETENNYAEFKNEIAEFEKSLTPKEETYNKKSYYDKKYDTLQLFSFNPNNTSQKKWKQLGLSDKQIKTLNNYLNKGGKFKYKTDLQKIYGISENQFQKLYPFINLPDKKAYAQNIDYETYDKTSKNNDDKKSSDYTIPDVEEYFKFNPNEISEVEWQKLGFSKKQIVTINNYLSKGGKFYKKEDLKKIYSIEDYQYERIKSFIDIPEEESFNNYKKEEFVENKKVDINNLSVEDMKKLGRFWQYRATRIVKYRNWLGGFYKKEQLMEVYGMKMEDYLKVKDDIIIDKSKLEKIHLNFAEVSELGRHPYISYEEAKKILNYRNKKGPFKQLEDLINKNLISEELYNKISPYLKVK